MCAIRTRGFTLIELLAVVAIIAVLVALLVPAVAHAMDRAKDVKCRSGTKQVISGVLLYAADHDGFYPPAYGFGPENTWVGTFQNQVSNYMGGRVSVWVCPSTRSDTKADSLTYGLHGVIFAYRDTTNRIDPGYHDYRPLRTTSAVRRPKETLAIADTCQLFADGSGGPGFSVLAYDENASMADLLIDTKYPNNLVFNTDYPDPKADKVIRYRHLNQSSANGGFFDGHVEGIRTNTLRNRNLATANY